MTELKINSGACPTCGAKRIIRVHRTKSERRWLKAKFFCQHCGDRFMLKRAEFKMLSDLLDGGKGACTRIKGKLSSSLATLHSERKKKGPHAPV